MTALSAWSVRAGRRTLVAMTVLFSLLHLSATAYARVVPELDKIHRELRVAEEVLGAALRDHVEDRVKISQVHAQYLARQGVLVSVNVSTPWISFRTPGENTLEIEADLQRLNEIPEMVHDILSQLDITIAPYEPEELEELRSLRDEQRSLREEQRRLRSRLREQRRELVRAEGSDERESIAEGITDLETELAASDAQWAAVNSDIDGQYNRLKDARSRASDRRRRQLETEEVAVAVARSVCEYGDVVKSLPADEHLTVVLRQGQTKRSDAQYYAFSMADVMRCQNDKLTVEQMLETAYTYSSR